MTRESIALTPQPPTAEAFAPYGTMLGRAIDFADAPPERLSWHETATDFGHEHDFDQPPGGVPEFIWVRYRQSPARRSRRLEMQPVHRSRPVVRLLTGAPDSSTSSGRSLADNPDQPDPDSPPPSAVPAGTRPCAWHRESGMRACTPMARPDLA